MWTTSPNAHMTLWRYFSSDYGNGCDGGGAGGAGAGWRDWGGEKRDC